MILNNRWAGVTLTLALGLGLTLNGCSPGTTDAGTGGGAATGGGGAATGGGGAVATGPFQTTLALAADAGPSLEPAGFMGVDGSRNVYFLTGSILGTDDAGTVRRRNFDGGKVETIIADASGFRGLDVDSSGNIYYGKNSPGSTSSITIYKVSPQAGSQPEDQATTTALNDIAVSRSGDIYFTAMVRGSIPVSDNVQKVGPGKTPVVIGNGLSDPHSLGIDSTNTIYVADTDNSSIKSFTAGGPDAGTVVTPMQPFSRALAVDNAGTLYYLDADAGLVMRQKGASTISQIPYTGPTPAQLRVDANGTVLYITDYTGNLYISQRQ